MEGYQQKRSVLENNTMVIGTNNSITRENWVINKLKRIPKGKKILDAGAGECLYKKYCGHLKYVSQDISQYDGKGNGIGKQTKTWDYSQIDIVSDIKNIPVKNSSFDVILCTEVFEHIPEPIDALKEFQRILKKGGNLIITAPFCSITHFAPQHYYTGFTKYFYEIELPKFGFKIVEITPNGNYFEYISQEMIRLPQILNGYGKGKLIAIVVNFVFTATRLIIENFYKQTKDSSTLLNFGYHVVGKKVS